MKGFYLDDATWLIIYCFLPTIDNCFGSLHSYHVLYTEIHFGTREHLHPVCLFKFKKYENVSKNSEKNWTQTYASNEHPWKISTENTNFSALCKKDKFLTKKNWYFLSTFYTSVRHLRMFVSNFFQIFPKHIQILKNQKANRVQVHPGAKVNIRGSLVFLLFFLFLLCKTFLVR